MDKKDKAANARLIRVYGIELSDYERMLASKGGGCWICGATPKSDRRHHIDHDHRVAKSKIHTYKDDEGLWVAYTDWPILRRRESSRKYAIAKVKSVLKKKSVRGILCWADNAALQKFRDNPDRMEKAAAYIREYQERLSG